LSHFDKKIRMVFLSVVKNVCFFRKSARFRVDKTIKESKMKADRRRPDKKPEQL